MYFDSLINIEELYCNSKLVIKYVWEKVKIDFEYMQGFLNVRGRKDYKYRLKRKSLLYFFFNFILTTHHA